MPLRRMSIHIRSKILFNFFTLKSINLALRLCEKRLRWGTYSHTIARYKQRVGVYVSLEPMKGSQGTFERGLV